MKTNRLYCEVFCREEQKDFFLLAKAKVLAYSHPDSYRDRRGSSTQDSEKKAFGLHTKYFKMKSNISLLVLCFLSLIACQKKSVNSIPSSTSVKSEIESVLQKQIFETWYPLVLDEVNGGYLSDFDYQWNQKGAQNKMIVTQARHVWTASKGAEFYPTNDIYRKVADHGFPFLRDVMWDETHGGFYNLVTQAGQPINDGTAGRILKFAYGNAFAIYGLAAYYKLSQNEEVLNLAKAGFQWLEAHSYDPEYGGYFQFLEQDGTPMKNGFGKTPPKDYNSSIHLLEAFAELYGVWKDDILRKRLEEMLVIVRDTMMDERGYLKLHFQADWTHLSYQDSTEAARKDHFNLDHVSYGHDTETAWLMMEATEALGNHHDELTLRKAKKMVDHSLRFGYDLTVGGVYDGAYYYKGDAMPTTTKFGKNWWAQVETLNTLLYLSKQFPNDPMNYYDKFTQQWSYIKEYLVDFEHGGVYSGGLDKEPERKTGAKSQIWKGAYHTGRSFMNCVKNL